MKIEIIEHHIKFVNALANKVNEILTYDKAIITKSANVFGDVSEKTRIAQVKPKKSGKSKSASTRPVNRNTQAAAAAKKAEREAKKAARKDAEGVEGAMAELAVSGEAEGENTS